MRRILTLALLAAASLATAGPTWAQPFVMSDDQADRVTAGGAFNVRVFKSVQEQKLIKIKAEVESRPKIRGAATVPVSILTAGTAAALVGQANGGGGLRPH